MSGIRVAQSGFKVTDPDYRQAFSSNWPILNIAATGFGTFGKGDKIVEHNLGYYPAFLIFINRSNNELEAGSAALADAFNDDFYVTKDSLYHSAFSSINTATIRFYIYNIDLEKQFQSQQLQIGTLESFRAKTSEAGVRFSKPRRTVNSRQFTDQRVRSDAIVPLIDSVNPIKKTATTTSVPHELGYPPKAFAYAYTSQLNGYQLINTALDSSVVSDSNSVDVSFSVGFFSKQSIIILKDPLRVGS